MLFLLVLHQRLDCLYRSAKQIESENASVLVPEKTIPAENLIQVVLFLMDHNTSRFELVKFDLDSSKARLNEILKEIPNVATDETLRAKRYVAICSRKGAEM